MKEELKKRFKSNQQEINNLLLEFQKILQTKNLDLIKNPSFIKTLQNQNKTRYEKIIEQWMKNHLILNETRVFNSQGLLLSSLKKESQGNIKIETLPSDKKVFLASSFLKEVPLDNTFFYF